MALRASRTCVHGICWEFNQVNTNLEGTQKLGNLHGILRVKLRYRVLASHLPSVIPRVTNNSHRKQQLV